MSNDDWLERVNQTRHPSRLEFGGNGVERCHTSQPFVPIDQIVRDTAEPLTPMTGVPCGANKLKRHGVERREGISRVCADLTRDVYNTLVDFGRVEVLHTYQLDDMVLLLNDGNSGEDFGIHHGCQTFQRVPSSGNIQQAVVVHIQEVLSQILCRRGHAKDITDLSQFQLPPIALEHLTETISYILIGRKRFAPPFKHTAYGMT